ncbi:PEP-CTERM sorting domain-containing protein [Megalodesulfovibrio paquesii]
MHTFFATLMLSLALLQASVAWAEVVTFGDTANYFGQGSSYELSNGQTWGGVPSLASQDQNGIPNLLGGTFTFEGDSLSSISVDLTVSGMSLSSANYWWSLIEPGDWFFDLDQDGFWDIVFHNDALGARDPGTYSSTWTAYSVHLAVFRDDDYASTRLPSYYEKSYSTVSSDPRPNQPIGVKDSYLTTPYLDANGVAVTASFDGWVDSFTKDNRSTTLTWDITGDLDFHALAGGSDTFTYYFTVSCANDVLYGENAPVPSPEPATMLLTALGALAVAAGRKRWARHNV